MIENLQNYSTQPETYLYFTLGLQVVLILGLIFTQFNFRGLIKVLDCSNDNSQSLIGTNEKLIDRCRNLIEEREELRGKNYQLSQKVRHYESIYGPINTES